MKLYADNPVRRTRQLAGDLLLALWVLCWVWLGTVVHGATLTLAAPGDQLESAGAGLAGRLRDAGTAVGGLPLVGDEVRDPFDGAGDAADRIAAAGAAQVEAVHQLAWWLGLAVAIVPVLVVLAVVVPLRWRFVREATAAERLLARAHTSGTDRQPLELFALRAMANQPLHRLARVSDDPVAAWRRGDGDAVHALALLELRDVGLRLRA
jgi:hypothetical protein